MVCHPRITIVTLPICSDKNTCNALALDLSSLTLRHFELVAHTSCRPLRDYPQHIISSNHLKEMAPSSPVSQGDYHYYNGDFYVTSSKNRHRRATLQELQTLFHPPPGQAPTKDHPAHWYRAQLLHYGLPPSDNKGTAAKRLLDAVNQGRLAVPVNLQLLEKELKKEWTANERKFKKERAEAEKAAKVSKPSTKKSKRKAGDDLAAAVTAATMAGLTSINVGNTNVNINVNIGGQAQPAATPIAKKRKAGGGDEGPEHKKSVKRQSSTATIKDGAVQKKASAAKSQQTASSSVQSATLDAGPTAIGNHPRPIQTARRSRPFHPAGEPRSSAAPSNAVTDEPEKPPKKQTARRGNYGGAQPRSPVKGQTKPPKLGYINGTYDVEVPGVDTSNSGIRLCLEDTSVWGEFQIGPITGVLFMPQRPYGVFNPERDDSHEACFFRWRAVDSSREYMPLSGPSCSGLFKFLGDGRIEGTFDSFLSDESGERFDCDIWAERVPNQGTKPSRSAWSMREEFDAIERNAQQYSSGQGLDHDGDAYWDDSYPDEPPPPYYSDEDVEMDDGW